MPRTLGGLFGFVLTATITFVVGMYVYQRVVQPALARFQKAA